MTTSWIAYALCGWIVIGPILGGLVGWVLGSGRIHITINRRHTP